jgi:hypothetical protein
VKQRAHRVPTKRDICCTVRGWPSGQSRLFAGNLALQRVKFMLSMYIHFAVVRLFIPGRPQQNTQWVWSSALTEIRIVRCVWVITGPPLQCNKCGAYSGRPTPPLVEKDTPPPLSRVPTGSGTRNDCAGEEQQQFAALHHIPPLQLCRRSHCPAIPSHTSHAKFKSHLKKDDL